MKFAAITSMSEDYYNKCGKLMLESFKRHWLDIMPLHVYNEDNFSLKDNSFVSMGWNLGIEYKKFQARHENNRIKTFAKKGFSIIHAMENINCEKLIWIDADVIINKPIDILENLITKKELSSHFSVFHEKDNKLYHSCETGFFIINKKHKGFKDFYNTYKNIYTLDQANDLRRFYDGEVYGKTVELMKLKGYQMRNLNPGKHKTPMPRSIIADYLTHHKAGLKERIQLVQ